MPRRRPRRTNSPANNHRRYGGRGTRANSKITRGVAVASLKRLTELLEGDRS